MVNGDIDKGLNESSEPSLAIVETVLTKTTANEFYDAALRYTG